MSDELFEIAFSGQIAAGQDPDQVRARIGAMFKAGDDKLAQLFSGKRIVIKKNVDRQTAEKYRQAINKAGAECEIVSLNPVQEAATAVAEPPQAPAPATSSPAPRPAMDHEVPMPPQTVPLHITAEEIPDLDVTIAPPGSDLEQLEEEVGPIPEVPDGISLAPVGTDLGVAAEKQAEPVLPDTSGLSLVDEK